MSNKVIIDCDAGVDDCQALMVALSFHCKGEIDILAITCVSGNVHVTDVIKNVKRCLSIKSIEQQKQVNIPIYIGATEPLIVDVEEKIKHAKFWHGNDGIGGASFAVDQLIQRSNNDTSNTSNSSIIQSDSTPAAVKIAELCFANPNDITIIAIGPLTNIALSFKLYGKQLVDVVHEILFMGGTRYARGNANLTSEFNAYADPEALQICLQNFSNKITMVGWDLTCKYGMPFDWVYENWFGKKKDDKINDISICNEFLSLISAEIVHKSRHGPWKDCGLLIPDPLAMCIAIDRSIIIESVKYFATVELNGKRTRGMVVVDYDELFSKNDEDNEKEKKDNDGDSTGSFNKNLCVVTKLDMVKVQNMLASST